MKYLGVSLTKHAQNLYANHLRALMQRPKGIWMNGDTGNTLCSGTGIAVNMPTLPDGYAGLTGLQ